MRTLVILNQKGGVGKTSTTVNLGAGLARQKQRVLLLDLDPQAHLTYSLGIMAHELPRTMGAVLTGECALADVARRVGDLDVVPASVALAGTEVELAGVGNRETRLKAALEGVEGYDFCLMDCPPNLGLLSLNALVAGTELLVPVQPEFLALQSLGKLMETVGAIRSGWNPHLALAGIVLTRFQRQKKLNREIQRNIRDYFKGDLLETSIRDNISLAEAPSFGQDIFTYKPRSNGAADYRNLALEVLRRGRPHE
ncbi:ParA family protein [Pseudodesulfovibrio piezophilus]|uniref:Sporulation initiation inhibitor protein soj n=1 Tax=Pseudodesulfovibrio piezophilus (strain DSM 21447 / JCM 15486 / C1TLV30) TaxID=1322246 RepID=M1WWZ8_PSEP2|nr:ParA family protein [Pseudodesulfovibrio piezophilus]CCH49413.1 Sporulation initiation inhibitor protein soj [Pseudodesulfovibrio piezophilus C1TLV30]